MERSRSRSLSDEFSYTYTGHRPDGGVEWTGSNGPIITPRSHEFIRDVDPATPGYDRKGYHDVEHAKYGLTRYTSNLPGFWQYPGVFVTCEGNLPQLTNNFINTVNDVFPPERPLDEEIRRWINSVTAGWTPVPGFDFLESVTEIGQLPNLARSLVRQAAIIPSFVNRTLRDWTRFYRGGNDIPDALRFYFLPGTKAGRVNRLVDRMVNQEPVTLREINNHGLATAFGTLPLVSDIKALYNLSDTISTRLNFLRGSKGKLTTLRASRTFGDLDGQEYLPTSRGLSYLRGPHSQTFRLRAGLYHNLRGLDEPPAFWNATRSYLGLNRPFSFLWDKVPYSFVLDWVAPVGDTLDHLEFPVFDGNFEIVHVSHSYTFNANINVWWWLGDVMNLFLSEVSENQAHLLGRIDVSYYRRRLGIPSASGFTTPTLFQLMLGSMLLGQQVRVPAAT